MVADQSILANRILQIEADVAVMVPALPICIHIKLRCTEVYLYVPGVDVSLTTGRLCFLQGGYRERHFEENSYDADCVPEPRRQLYNLLSSVQAIDGRLFA